MANESGQTIALTFKGIQGKDGEGAAVDQELNIGSTNAISNSAVTAALRDVGQYKLTANKMSTAWGTHTVSGGKLTSGTVGSNYASFEAGRIGAASGTNGAFVVDALTEGLGTVTMKVANGSDSTVITKNSVTTTGQMNAANGFFQTSDIRKKNFGSDVEVNFEELKSIPKKYFEWKNDPDAGQQIGTSAQALLRVYPEIVSRGEDGFYSVDYAKLSIIALAAIDKLNDRISYLESEIKKLKQ